MQTPEEPAFRAVPWLPPFRLVRAVLLDGPLEVTLPPDALFPFALLRVAPDGLSVRPEAPEAAALEPAAATLQARLRAVPGGDLSVAARRERWLAGTALAAAQATESLRRLGSPRAWLHAAAEQRRRYLEAVSAGAPPPAAEVVAACRAVPQALRHLGKALPTAEALRLLAPLGRICELGAGFGLFARALERAGMAVAASDAGTSGETGIAFPVRKGFDAAATLRAFAALGKLPPLLLVWPQPEEGDWFAQVFEAAAPGQVIAMASPEVEFCALGGLAAATHTPADARWRGWQAATDLAARLRQDFVALGEAPVVAAGWPAATTPLRLWQRR